MRPSEALFNMTCQRAAVEEIKESHCHVADIFHPIVAVLRTRTATNPPPYVLFPKEEVFRDIAGEMLTSGAPFYHTELT
jgi:hypothetical protein